jgi:D-glycero-D-manno-heptose 1,7-bisphosphate phosphatase
MLKPALFLDRDGVINRDYGYVHRPEDFDWIPGVFDTLRTADALGLNIVVVTNQAGIARGRYSEEQFQRLSAWMCERLVSEGVKLTGIYYCPSHPDGQPPYRQDSPLRKPKPGMLLLAAAEHRLDLSRSLMIGDHESDVLAARAAGLALAARFAPDGCNDSAADIVLRSHVDAQQWLHNSLARLRSKDDASE